MKKVFLIHGWGGNPKNDWFPWIKKELKLKGFKVEIPAMPNTNEPKIKEWIGHLKKIVKNPDKDTYFIGHSIGCQTILRYLESLDKNIKIGGCIFIAPWFNLIPKIIEEEGGTEIARSWIETPMDFKKIILHTTKFLAIFSDNDYFVPLTDAKLFKERIKAKVIIEHNKGHFNKSDGVKEIKIVINELLKFTQEIKEARERVKKGEFYTEEEAKKILGI